MFYLVAKIINFLWENDGVKIVIDSSVILFYIN